MDRFAISAGLQGDKTETVEGAIVIGLNGEDLSEKRFGFLQPTGSVVAASDGVYFPSSETVDMEV